MSDEKRTGLENITWLGYERKNGAPGIRNRILVIYTVKCSEFVARQIVERSGHTDVELIGFDGCTDNQYAVDLLISMIRHPNVGAVLAVGLGCEYIQPEWLSDIAKKEGKPAAWMFIQNEGGTRPAVEKGLSWVKETLETLKDTPRVTMGLRDLVIGAECGGSDYTSGLAGNVVVGRFYDKLVDLGGTAIFEEIVEAIGLDSLLIGRAASAQAAKELRYTYDKALDYCKSVRQYSVSPGNFAGGLSTIEEKSMGAVIKSGSRPIQGVTKVSVPPPRRRPLAFRFHAGSPLDAVRDHQPQRQRGADGSGQLRSPHCISGDGPRKRGRQRRSALHQDHGEPRDLQPDGGGHGF